MGSLLDFTPRGPHPVGVRTAKLRGPAERMLEADLWYPASAAGAAAEEAAEHPFRQPHRAVQGAPAAPGPFPVVVFSHGNSGTRRQSTFLTTHLASWGFAVVAPDHPRNTFAEMAALRSDDERREVHFEVRRHRPADVLAALDAALDGEFGIRGLDGQRIVALGHSFGGWTVTKLPGIDDRIRAVCAMAPASEAFVGRKAYAADELPFAAPLPSLLVAGVDDVLVDLATSVVPLYERLGAMGRLLRVDGADHYHFCDGIELLHSLHRRNPRKGQLRPTRLYADLLPQARMHRSLQAVVTSFFAACLGDGAPAALAALDALDDMDLEALDPALRRGPAWRPPSG